MQMTLSRSHLHSYSSIVLSCGNAGYRPHTPLRTAQTNICYKIHYRWVDRHSRPMSEGYASSFYFSLHLTFRSFTTSLHHREHNRGTHSEAPREEETGFWRHCRGRCRVHRTTHCGRHALLVPVALLLCYVVSYHIMSCIAMPVTVWQSCAEGMWKVLKDGRR